MATETADVQYARSVFAATYPERARVAALAGAGEVLVSQTVRDLVAGSEIEFGYRVHELRGSPGEWRLYAVLDA